MWKKFNKYVQQCININYNKIKNKKEYSVEDAAFITFLDFFEKLLFFLFLVVAIISSMLFLMYEVTPLFW